LLAVKPTGQRDYEEVEGLYDMGHCAHRLSVILSDINIIWLVRISAPYATPTNEILSHWRSRLLVIDVPASSTGALPCQQ
jgi:hypothetical protein